MRRAVACAAAAAAMAACGGAGSAARSGGAARPGAPHVVPGDLDAQTLLGDLPGRAAKLGGGPVSLVAAGETVDGERLGGFVDIPKDQCLLGYARGSSSIEDLDVAIFAEEGNPIAADEAPDAHPTVLLCPPHPERVYVAVHTATGEGLVALAAQLLPRDRAADAAHTLGARGGRGGGPRPADAWPGLEDHVRAHRAALGGAWEELRKVAVTVDARSTTEVALPVEANQCIDALIVPDDDVAMLDVEALDGDGRIVVRAHEGGRNRSVTLCSPLAFSGALAIRPHVGSGLAAVVLAKSSVETARDAALRPQVAWLGATATLDAARAARNAELGKAGYGPASMMQSGSLLLGRRATVAVDLAPAPACSRVDVVGGSPVALLSATAWDGAALLGAADGASGATVFVCGRARAQLEVETRARAGPYAVLVRPERWKDPAFTAHPIAAGRMLTRAAAGPGALFEGAPLASRAFSLDPSRRVSYLETTPPGQCLHVTAGAEGEGVGLELRVIDAVTGEELDREVAETAVAARACAAPGAARSIRVELRGTSGKLDAVVGGRLTPGWRAPPSP